MSPLPERVYTAEEYLAFERAVEHRNEFIDGRIYPKLGGSITHASIVGNLLIEIHARLRGRPCTVLAAMRIKVTRTEAYLYPDVVAFCEPPLLEDAHQDTLLNPGVIIEVLSEATERYDRGEKFAHYRKIESLREYILVAQDKVRVERYVRHGERWMLSEISHLDAFLRIETLDCEVSLRDIYDRIELPE